MLGLPAAGQEFGLADPHIAAISALIASGDYERAESEATVLRTALSRARTTKPSDAQQATDILVEALCRNGKGSRSATRELAEQVLSSRVARVGPEDPSLATSMRNLGDVLLQSGQYQAAVQRFRALLSIRERALGPEDPEVAEDLDHLARALLAAELLDEALTVADRALQIKERALSVDDVRIARSLDIQGQLLQRKSEHRRARAALERAVELQDSPTVSLPERAATLSVLGEQYWFDGDLVKSKESGTRALSLAESSLRPQHPDLSLYLRRVTLSLLELGYVAEAREYRERALSIARAELGPTHPALALQMNDLAGILGRQADYFAARALFEQALEIAERMGLDSASAIAAIYNLGVVNALIGDDLGAERYYRRAIAAWTRVNGAQHSSVAFALSGLADLRQTQGMYSEARQLYEQALAIREARLGPNAPDVARTLKNLARTLLELDQTPEAYALATRATAIWERAGGQGGAGYHDALTVRAAIQSRMGDQAAATLSYNNALTIMERLYGPIHPDLTSTKNSLAIVQALQGDRLKAIDTALESEKIVREHLTLAVRYLAERQALGYAARRHEALDILLSLAKENPTLTTSILDRVVRARSLTLDEMAWRHHAAADAGEPGVADLRVALNSARQRVANLVVKGAGRQSPDQYATLLEDATRQKELLERGLLEKSVAFRSEMDRSDVGLKTVQGMLPERSALVSFYRYDRIIFPDRRSGPSAPEQEGESTARLSTVPSYVAFVVRPGGSDTDMVALGEAAAIDELVGQWRSEIMSGLRVSGPAVSERKLRQLGSELRQRLWEPIASHVAGAERVFVVPDGSVNLVSLTALPIGQTGYLLEQGPMIHYLSTERDLVVAKNLNLVGNGLLAMGAPSFEHSSPFNAPEKRPTPGGNDLFRGAVSKCPSFQTMQFSVLPATGKEANYVAGLWKEFGPPATGSSLGPKVLLGSAADERSFKQLSPGNRVLHLATHGFFLGGDCNSALDGNRSVGGLVTPKKPKPANTKAPVAKAATTLQAVGTGENPLLLSGLALAGANRRAAATANEDDGILTAEEVASLDLSGVEWAVLSACDTGLGEIKAGEGVFGLRRAFQIAGAHTVIMSLWSVEDRAAMTWMRALYEGRLARKLDTASAVREASLVVLRQRRARGQSTHPFYWAGFVASGDWR